ncbi:MAG TPA: condensation domain-containing protein, partial [Amycolatopsis sp.]|uniref:condensation domain-containing protein n=1 Tax=Amycolatopsis sp. TaxID=37632 RepID=UPI002B47420F
PAPERRSANGRAPATPVEELLCGLYADILGRDTVGADDSFFTLGGDSIMSMLVVARARRAGVEITARQVFECRTPANLARVADTITRRAATPDVAVGPVPLTPMMRELAARSGPAALSGSLAQSMLVALPPGADLDGLSRALQVVLDHHDMLRARLDGDRLLVPEPGAVRAEDCVRVALAAPDAEFGRALGRLDPASGVVVQAVWFPDSGRLLLVLHHLVVDGVSWRILLPDLAAAYAGEELTGGTSFRRWASALATAATSADRVAELPVWRGLLDEADPRIGPRPLDSTVDTVAAGTVGTTREVPAAVTGPLLTGVPEAFYARVDEVLLAGLAVAVCRWRGGDTVLVDVENHGREPLSADMQLGRTIGWFTCSRPVRLTPGSAGHDEVAAGGAAAGTVLKRIKEQLRAIPADGLGFGLLRYLNPDTAPVLADAPVPQIGFNYLGRFTAASTDGTGAWQPVGDLPLGGRADDRMALSHAIEAGGLVRDRPDGPELTVTVSAPAGLLGRRAVDELTEYWVAALTGFVRHLAGPAPGGHTPSDFTLLTLAQNEIDEFQSKLTGQGGSR